MTKKSFKLEPTWKIFGEVVGAAIAVLVLTLLLPLFPFIITSDYSRWLPVGIASAVITALIKSLGHLLVKPWVYLTQGLSILVSIYSTVLLATIFPFDFYLINYELINPILKFALWVSIFAMVLAFLVNFLKFLIGLVTPGNNRKPDKYIISKPSLP